MARMSNVNIRLMMQDNGVKQCQIAKRMGITQRYLSYLLCKPLTPENSDRIMKALYEIVEEKGNAENKSD